LTQIITNSQPENSPDQIRFSRQSIE